MLHFLAWYVTLLLLNLITFPLSYHLFPKLADRGYTLSRALGLLIWSYAFWMLTSLGITQNNLGGILSGLAILAGFSFWATKTTPFAIFLWLKKNIKLILTVESLFLASFAALALLRAANPEALGTEKPMELAFINAILRSPAFPPRDPWLAGYAISYYHFGYIITALLAKLTATPGSIAFNLMLALVFALSAIGSYGILYNLLALKVNSDSEENSSFSIHRSAFLAPLFLLLVSNFEALLELLHQKGIFWVAGKENFWTWLNIKTLNENPASLQPIPERFWWWWRASRVVQDYDLAGNFREVIDEFPAFSFLLGDLHPHVLALPFALLAVAIALHLYFGGWKGERKIFNFRFHITPTGIFLVAFTLGGLAFLNTWDILIAAALIAAAYTLRRARAEGWSWQRLEDFIYFGMLTGIAAILLYLPFYLGFSSQAGGILPNLINPTRGAHLWVMFGTLLLPILAWMIVQRRGKVNWKHGFGLVFGLLIALWLFSWLVAWAASIANSSLATNLIYSQGLTSFSEVFVQANARRLSYIAGALTLLLVAGGAVSLLFFKQMSTDDEQAEVRVRPADSFILLLILLGALLVIAPEFFYLRDQFGTRMNTIFKFYYQAWLLWSLAAAYGSVKLLQRHWGFRVGLSLLLVAGLLYPLYGVLSKTNGFKPAGGLTLDSAAQIERNNPNEAAAIEWLQSAPDGVVLEAVGGSYTGYARISTNTGLPTVLGWPGHESQWRGGYEEMGSRQSDVERIYKTTNWEEAKTLLDFYGVRYVVVGSLELTTYQAREEKFKQHLEQVFSQGETSIYLVP